MADPRDPASDSASPFDAEGGLDIAFGGPDALGRGPSGVELYEVATEVCNKVGGIYQVIRSKVEAMVDRWRSRYTLVGPYIEKNAALEFEERQPHGRLRRVADILESQGIKMRYGTWLVSGRPRVLLLEHRQRHRIDALKYELWEQHALGSPAGNPIVDDSVLFADAVFKLFAALCDERSVRGNVAEASRRRILAHFHEWLGGLAIPRIRKAGLPVATVFTTHATLLGRYIASNDEWFYDRLPHLNHAEQAQKYNITCEHHYERACAHGSHVFTTVSGVTAEECQHLLGRRPDVITPNGLNMARYSVGHEFQTLHAEYKAEIHRFTTAHFFPSYAFDLDRTLYVFTSGRFEPRNKGYDMALEAMARLNAILKAANADTTVVFFIVTQRPTHSINPICLQNRGILEELEDTCDRLLQDIRRRMMPLAAAGRRVNLDEMVQEYWALRYRRTQQAFRRDDLPLVVTHMLQDDAHDPVLNQIRQLGLVNRPEDRVKVVYHPDFINSTNPLWNLEYEQFVRGCHIGVFPSAYEPWGYTPLECVAVGVPAATSDLAGFGRYVEDRLPDHEQWGLHVMHRRGRHFHESAAELARWLHAFCRLDRRDRIALRNEVEARSWHFDWSSLAQAYHEAHDRALAALPG